MINKKLIICAVFCFFSHLALAQKTYIGYIYPAGGCRGDEFVITIGGQSIANCKDVLISGKGIKAEIIPLTSKQLTENKQKKNKKNKNITDEDNLQLADKLSVKITIEQDAPLGLCDFKLVAANGSLSNRLFFEVSQYPNFLESEANNSLSEANKIMETPVVINGQVEKGGRDFFSFQAKKGQSIVAQTKARRFVPFLADAVPGWFQAVTTLYNSKWEEVCFSDDFNLDADPTIIYNVPKTDTYYLEIKDAIYRGRADFVYRIALGELPFVSSVFPLGYSENSTFEIDAKGVNLGKTKYTYSTPEATDKHLARLATKGGYESNEFNLQISSGLSEQIISKDLGEGKNSATLLTDTTVINARIEHEYDHDWYVINAKKGQRWSIDLTARRLGSSLDASITVFDDMGNKIKQEDDTIDPMQGAMTHHADPQLSYKFTKDGSYYIRVSDTQNKYGDNYAYRLRAYQAQSDFSLRVEPSAISIPQGGSTQITVFPVRKNNFKAPITISSEDLPQGFSMSELVLNGWNKSGKLSITAPQDAPLGKCEFTIKGSAKLANQTIERTAQGAEAMLQAFYITHLLPTDEFRIDVSEAKPFTLSIHPEDKNLQLDSLGKASLRVIIDRKDNYSEPILVMYKSPIKGISANPVTAEPGDEYVSLEIEAKTWGKANKTVQYSLLGTVKATTNAKVAGQKKNSISASIMVLSPFFTIKTPNIDPPQKQKEN